MEAPNPKPGPSASTTESLHLGELLNIVSMRRKILAIFTAATLTGTLFREVIYVPNYPATATLSIQKAEQSPMQAALANLSAGYYPEGAERLQKYLTYLNSAEYFLAVAENLKFQEGYNRLNLTQPWELSVTRKKFWQQFIFRHFGTRIGSDPAESANPEPVLVPVERLAGIIQSMTSASTAGSDSIRLTVTALDAFTAMVLANTAADVFVKKTGERDYNEVNEVKRFIQQQLDNTTERLKRSELALVEFKKRHNIISINAEHSSASGKVNALETELESTRLKYEENQRLVEYYSNALQKTERALLSQGSAGIRSSPGAVAARLRQQIDGLRYKKVLMQAQGYAEDSWQMSELNREIDKAAGMLKEQLAAAGGGAPEEEEVAINVEDARGKLAKLKQENTQLAAKIRSIEKSKGTLMQNLGALPKDEQVLLTLTRDVDLQFELYSSLKKKLQEVEIQQVALQSHVNIGQRAGVPGPAARTSLVVKLLFALLVGVFLGCSTAFLLEAVDPTVKHRSDLDALEMITLGTIPHVEGSEIRKTLGGQSYRPDLLICREKPESPESMAFKHIRTQIALMRGQDGKPAKVITITSAERGDGKSFVSANLAVSLSQLEKRTILIDCDFRNPSQPWMFGYKESDGLSGLLSLRCSLEEILIRERAPNLDVLPTGWAPSNPSELLSNEKFRILVEHLRQSYDYVILDAPPAVAVVDAAVLASISDSVVMIASFRKTRKDMVLMALRKILQITHKHVYAVLNNVWEIHEYKAYGYPTTAQGKPSSSDVDVRHELAKFEESLQKRKAS